MNRLVVVLALISFSLIQLAVPALADEGDNQSEHHHVPGPSRSHRATTDSIPPGIRVRSPATDSPLPKAAP